MTDKLIYGKDSTNNIVSIEIVDDSAELFIESNGKIESKFVKNKYWLLTNKPLKNFIKLKGELYYKYGIQFNTFKEFNVAKRQLKNQDTFVVNNAKEAHMQLYGRTYYKDMKIKDVSILSFDIETTGLKHNNDSKIVIISNTYRNGDVLERKLFCYNEFSSQGEMLETWCSWVREKNPSILAGHNICLFDLPYIQFIADKENVQLELGRNGSSIKFDNFESKFRKDASQFYHYKKPKVYGREIVDTFFLSVKYDVIRKYESYGLKQIIKQEGLEIKDRVFYDASKIRFTYTNPVEFEKIKEYALFDADDALALFDLMAPAIFYMSQTVPKSFQAMMETATGSQINSVLIRNYLQDGHSLPKASDAEEYSGGISLGHAGVYHNAYKLDIKSMYPSIILQYEVYDKEKDPNGYFLQLVKVFTEKRFKDKKIFEQTKDKKYDDLQAAGKIFVNSSYGTLGAPGLLFNSPSKASFITKTGRDILNKSMDWANTKGFTLINADTDSISFNKEDHSEFTQEEQQNLLNEINSLFPEKIKFDSEGVFQTVIILKAKNYVLKKKGQKPIYKGSAIKATLKEKRLKEFIKEIIKEIALGRENYREVYNKYVIEIMSLKSMDGWTTKKTITDKVLGSERTNEAKVRTAIENSEYAEGDKVQIFFKEDGTVCLAENFNGDYSKEKLLNKLYQTGMIFSNIIDCSCFLNYKLKRNKASLDALLK